MLWKTDQIGKIDWLIENWSGWLWQITKTVCLQKTCQEKENKANIWNEEFKKKLQKLFLNNIFLIYFIFNIAATQHRIKFVIDNDPKKSRRLQQKQMWHVK